ncbi:Small acid-soluble spore protein (Thioredoxin-like protein) OS=Ureibacillus acetophenoni OX=614649 GN=SAMN05877842_10351 PE=3 SV=1 [Ureibacillus acetophenoni]
MSEFRNKPNPDDRSDNVEKLQAMIQNTEEKIHKAETSMEFSGSKQQEQINAKNERRRQAIQGFKEEIKDEAHRND